MGRGRPREGGTMTTGNNDDFARRIAAATEFLESVNEDYVRLATLPKAERRRFLTAAGRVARPGPWDRSPHQARSPTHRPAAPPRLKSARPVATVSTSRGVVCVLPV